MNERNPKTTHVYDTLPLSDSIGTFSEVIEKTEITGPFDNFLYYTNKGKQVLLEHLSLGSKLGEDSRVNYGHEVFMSKNDGKSRARPTSWEELRTNLEKGYVLGTDRRPGIKVSFPHTGRNGRLSPDAIYVLPK